MTPTDKPMTIEALIDELISAARLLGNTQAAKIFGKYTVEDARFEGSMHELIAKYRAAIEQYGRERETSGFECGVLAEFKATEWQGSSEPADEVMQRAADEIERLTAERDALRVYADRCRWIAAYCRFTAEHWGGRWSIVVEGPAPTRDDEDAFYAAIDAARAAPKGTT